jgi:hypothetical protein
MISKALEAGFVPNQRGDGEANFSCAWTDESVERLVRLLKLRIRGGPPANAFDSGRGPEHRNGKFRKNGRTGSSHPSPAQGGQGTGGGPMITAELDTGPPKRRRPGGKPGQRKLSISEPTIDIYAGGSQLSSNLVRAEGTYSRGVSWRKSICPRSILHQTGPGRRVPTLSGQRQQLLALWRLCFRDRRQRADACRPIHPATALQDWRTRSAARPLARDRQAETGTTRHAGHTGLQPVQVQKVARAKRSAAGGRNSQARPGIALPRTHKLPSTRQTVPGRSPLSRMAPMSLDFDMHAPNNSNGAATRRPYTSRHRFKGRVVCARRIRREEARWRKAMEEDLPAAATRSPDPNEDAAEIPRADLSREFHLTNYECVLFLRRQQPFAARSVPVLSG